MISRLCHKVSQGGDALQEMLDAPLSCIYGVSVQKLTDALQDRDFAEVQEVME